VAAYWPSIYVQTSVRLFRIELILLRPIYMSSDAVAPVIISTNSPVMTA